MISCSAGLCRRVSSVIWMLVLRGFGGINLAPPRLGGLEELMEWIRELVEVEYKSHWNLETILTIAHCAPELDAAVDDRLLTAFLLAR